MVFSKRNPPECRGSKEIGCGNTARPPEPSSACSSEERLRTLIANIPDVVWTIDSQFQFVFISPNIERISGFALDEVYQRGPRLYLDCLRPDDQARVTEGLQALFEHGRPYDIECRVRRKSGEWIWVHDRAYSTYERDGILYANGILSDITGRKHTEEALRRAEAQYRTLFQGIGDAVFLMSVGPDLTFGRFLAVNDVACERLGYTRDELLQMGPSDVDELARLRAVPSIPCLMADGHLLFETVQVAKGGRKMPVEINVRLVEFEGRPAGLAIARDISDRKRAEEALQQSEENYRRLIANLPDVTWTSDAQGHTTYISPNVEEVFGFTPAEIVERGDEVWLGRIHPVDAPRVLHAYTALFEQNHPFNEEYRVQRKDGEWIWVHDRSFATHEVEGTRFADGVFSDITRRKQAEQMLASSEERLRSLIESTQDWVWEVDAHGRYTYCSPRVKNLLGYEPEEVLGRTPFDFMDPDEAGRCGARFASIVEARAPLRNLENTNLHKNGRSVILETNGLAILDENGDLVGYRGIDRDITERRLAERELQRAKDAAEAANRAKSEFLANMSHEIRTPLNGILGMVDMTVETDLTSQQRDYLGIVKDSAESLLSIINDILDFSKIEAGKLDFDSAPFDLRDALAPTVRALAVSAQRKGLALNYFVAPEIPRVLVGDPGRVRQILLNLVGNAVKFTERGQVTVQLQQDSADSENVWLHLSVADTGVGIAPDRLNAVFDAFDQADTSTTRRYGGTGLGLTIARKLTEMMAGRIYVESTLGIGSTFHCNLRLGNAGPLQTAAGRDDREPLQSPAAARRKPAACGPILVAEDNAVNQAISVALLQRNGYQVELAANGREAVERFRANPIEAVLMDVQMPEMDGFEATAAIRDLEARTGTHVPIIAMTAHAMKGDRERCLAAGMDAYVSKPVRASELLALLENLISRA